VSTVQVCITGLGVVCAAGRNVETFWASLLSGQPGLSPVEGIPIARGKQLGGQVKDPAFAGPHHLSAMAAAALEEALTQAGWGPTEKQTCGFFLATVAGESRLAEDHYADLNAADRLTPTLRDALLRYPNGSLADLLAARFGLAGPRDVSTNACASGNIALARALLALRSGELSRAIVCGADQLKPIMYWGAERAGLMGQDLRPFHKDRDGTAFGDGAGVLILETADSARARGAKVLAAAAGWGVVCDEDPQLILPQLDGGAVARGFRAALTDAGLSPEDVDHINAHGTGTINIDRIEAIACKKVFGERATSIPVTATKSLTGHLSAASPVIEAIASVLAIEHGYVHPTAKLDEPDPTLGLDFVAPEGRKTPVRCVLSNSMGGGGTNAAVVLTAPGFVPARPARISAKEDDIVVTGLGAVSPWGTGADVLVAAARAGVPLERGRATGFHIHDFVDRKLGYEHLSRAAQLAMAAGTLATTDARLLEAGLDPDRLAVVFGTAFGGTPSWSDMLCAAYAQDPRRITPNMALEHGHHLGVTLVARHVHARGPNCTFTGGATSGLEALAFGAQLLQSRTCDAVLVGGSDALDAALDRALNLLGCARRDTAAPPPYDPRGAGFLPAEGAGCLVLERRQSANARGAKIWGTWRGFGHHAVPVGLAQLDEEGLALREAMRQALSHKPEGAAHRVRGPLGVLGAAHGSAAFDAAEAMAVSSLRELGESTVQLASLRGVSGESFAAAPLLSAITALATPGVAGEQAAAWERPWLLVNAAATGGAAASALFEREGGRA
jgi:3-oxoacyl-[acyl-carrier-protein] synthase II